MRACIALLALAAALLACRDHTDERTLVAAGHVEATEVRVAPEVGGRVVALTVREGDRVRAGQEIARLDPTDVRLALDGARAERQSAEAELRLRRAGARREEIAEAEAVVAQGLAELEGAQRDLDRAQRLLDLGSGTPKARDDALARRDAAAGRVEAARQRLRRLRAGSRREEIEVARGRVEATDARIAQLEEALADARVTSPASGIVTDTLVEQGEIVAPMSPLALVVDLEHAWLTVYVPGPDLGRIRIGQDVRVVSDDGTSRPGRVTFVASEAEFTPRNVQTRDERVTLVYRVKIALDNRDGFYKPGMPAEARVPVASQAARS